MKEIYQRLSFFSLLGGLAASFFIIFYYLILYENFAEDGIVLLEIGVVAMVAIGTSIYFNKASKQLFIQSPEEEVSDFDGEAFTELNIQVVPGAVPTMYNVNGEGEVLFKIEPTKRNPLMRKLSFFNLFASGFLFSMTYDILNMQNQILASYTRWTNGNRFILTLYNVENEKVAVFEQRLTKSKFKNKGILYNADGEVWRELEAKNVGGDIDVLDKAGNVTAFYRYGVFPYALHPAFQKSVLNHHIRFSHAITLHEKWAYTMIFYFWLREVK